MRGYSDRYPCALETVQLPYSADLALTRAEGPREHSAWLERAHLCSGGGGVPSEFFFAGGFKRNKVSENSSPKNYTRFHLRMSPILGTIANTGIINREYLLYTSDTK